ncbi:hypothetical Protein YC6258_00709 [Gynuella sunshinyii YC6258]|uniref:Uncharacterized protein n=1 Tax=Gynuella sunshinyii YC6258 TaxID=1445510 RepID=A0A0C5VRB4_9GAMM|nr:hypothetical Protein YC6258_00709 [Gynuella sunshinyii YC6258]
MPHNSNTNVQKSKQTVENEVKSNPLILKLQKLILLRLRLMRGCLTWNVVSDSLPHSSHTTLSFQHHFI